MATLKRLEKRIPKIQKKMEVTDFYVDGGYFSGEVERQAQDDGITMHYTDMTGKQPDPSKASANRIYH
ncbi:MAG TPA: hypothetical protein DCK76_00840 [Desulfotomaculum sp.]|nr:hypothetical protein [Desulfotomaculum sp.]HBY05302.1 hypothetical protein [Desulfotomaculum sp.]